MHRLTPAESARARRVELRARKAGEIAGDLARLAVNSPDDQAERLRAMVDELDAMTWGEVIEVEGRRAARR